MNRLDKFEDNKNLATCQKMAENAEHKPVMQWLYTLYMSRLYVDGRQR